MSTATKAKSTTTWSVPLILLVVCILAYGLLIPDLGLYWDDLPYALVNHRFGPAGYPDFVASDRPHSAWVFMGLTWLLGANPIGYHIFGLLLYWGCALLFWLLLRQVWPQHENEALWAALLFAVYPGFLGQPKTIIYNHHFSAMALYLFSLIGTVKAVQVSQREGGIAKSWRWHLPAVLAAGLSQFTIEYYIGWEAVRLVVVWILLARQNTSLTSRLQKSLLHMVPYGLVTLAFLIWRVFIFRFPTYQLLGGEGANIVSLAWWRDVFTQVIDALVVVWGYAFPRLSSQDYSQTFWLAYLLLTIFATVLVFFFLRFFHRKSQQSERNHFQQKKADFGLPAVLMALAGIGFAGWPFWLVNLQLNIGGHFYSRFTLVFIPWAALFWVGVFHWIAPVFKSWSKVITAGLIAFLVGGSIGWHFWNANLYRNQWVDLQRYFQQLVRRAPGLAPGTILLINDLQSLSLYQDDSLTALLNWTYATENKTNEFDFAVFYLSVRLGLEFPTLEAGWPIEKDFRSFHFSSSTDNLLVVHSEPPDCLRVLDPNRPDRNPLMLPKAMSEAIPLSNLDLIQTDQTPGAALPEHLFELEETDYWCIYFQDAELASQRGDWARVAEIGYQAYASDDLANELTEHFVFIDGFLRTGDIETALSISQMVSEASGGAVDGRICGIWRGTGVETGPGSAFEQLCLSN
ncbi:MAG: hypothetical protein ACNA70_00090 [Brevefilum sp.]